MLYVPGYFGDPNIVAEFNKLSEVINKLVEENFPVSFKPPEKPRTGMVRYADGSSWNPGSGEGLYSYNGNIWVQLGGGSGAQEALAYFMADD